MIDLHTHTTYSDGRDDVITLLKKAEEKKLEYLSITDHGTCKAYEEMKNMNVSQYYTGKIIAGCELHSKIDGTSIELLGYNVDIAFLNQELPKIYKYTMQEIFANRYNNIIQVCKNIGIVLEEEKIKFDSNATSATRAILPEIIRHEENKKLFDNQRAWGDPSVFYRECISNPKSKFFVDDTGMFPNPIEVVQLIKKAGGLVFIPHIFVYGENSIKFLKELTKHYEIDGIECYYNTFTEEQTEYLLNFCRENEYYISGGSDYHGALKPDIDIGVGEGNLNIPSSIVQNWIMESD